MLELIVPKWYKDGAESAVHSNYSLYAEGLQQEHHKKHFIFTIQKRNKGSLTQLKECPLFLFKKVFILIVYLLWMIFSCLNCVSQNNFATNKEMVPKVFLLYFPHCCKKILISLCLTLIFIVIPKKKQQFKSSRPQCDRNYWSCGACGRRWCSPRCCCHN